MSSPGFSWITPVVFVRDLVASLRYYERILGFDLKWQWSEQNAFAETVRPTAACVYRGDYGLFLNQKNPFEGAGLVCLNVRTAGELDSLYREFSASGAKIVEPPQDRPVWGMRDMVIQDPDGNTFRIGLPLEGPKKLA
ncbi:MAG: VOC family protein [Verrucomicrobia bacterium]|nr:VOC family protein [Verrucomicrobiota bacterium]